MKHLVCFGEFTCGLAIGREGLHLGPPLNAVKQKDKKGGSTATILFGTGKYELTFKRKVALISLLLIVLSKYSKASHYLLLDIAIEFYVALDKALIEQA